MSQQEKENWINKALQIAMVGLLSWNVITTHQLSVSMAVLKEKVDRIETVLSY
jgi:hypothetical protein